MKEKLQEYALIAEIISALAIVASLIFVGLQIENGSRETRASNNAVVADTFRELNLVLATNTELSNTLLEFSSDPDQASPEVQAISLSFHRSLFHIWSNAHRQWTNETLDRALYESIITEISTYTKFTRGEDSSADMILRGRGMLWAWEREGFIFNKEFQDFFEEVVETGSVKE